MKPSTRLGLGVLAVLACARAVAGPDDFRCFKSLGHQPPIRLQIDFSGANEGYVRYEHGSGRIPVVNTATRELRAPPDRPREFTMRWREQVQAQAQDRAQDRAQKQDQAAAGAGGEYVMTSQGARVSDFRYIRAKDGKVFRFEEDLPASGENACTWNQ